MYLAPPRGQNLAEVFGEQGQTLHLLSLERFRSIPRTGA